jgi:SAM-dependent methyltransferase
MAVKCQAERQLIKHEILIKAKDALDGAGVPFWLSCGVLLGYYRDGDTIPHDPDVDLGIWATDRPDDLDRIMADAGFSKVIHAHDNPDCEAYRHKGIKLDLFFHRKNPHGMVTLDLVDRGGSHVVYRYEDFDLIPVRFLCREFMVPRNPLKMIQTHYGDDWYIPVKEWKWDKSPRHIPGSKPNENYWDAYYKKDGQSNPSMFARHCLNMGNIKGKVIEFGCGDGRDSRFFMSATERVTGIDQSEVATDILKIELPEARWLCDDFSHLRLPKENGTFDAVYSRFTLHSLTERNERRALKCAHDLLKTGGYLLIECRSTVDEMFGKGAKIGHDEYVNTHYRRFMELDTLSARVESAGFEIVEAGQSRGWAVQGDEDPEVIRIVARKRRRSIFRIWQRNVTAIVKTYEMPKSVRRCVESLRKFYPKIHIIVLDDSRKPSPVPGCENICMTYEVGLSSGRNIMLDRVKTPYFILLEDDFVFTPETNIRKMYRSMKKNGLDLVAGAVRNTGPKPTIMDYRGIIGISEGRLLVERKHRAELTDCLQYDLVLNFFLASTDAIRDIRWDDRLKMSEHLDFFLRAMDRITIGRTDGAIINHDRAEKRACPKYKQERVAKAYIGRADMMAAHGLNSITVNGTTHSISDVVHKARFAHDELYFKKPPKPRAADRLSRIRQMAVKLK